MDRTGRSTSADRPNVDAHSDDGSYRYAHVVCVPTFPTVYRVPEYDCSETDQSRTRAVPTGSDGWRGCAPPPGAAGGRDAPSARRSPARCRMPASIVTASTTVLAWRWWPGASPAVAPPRRARPSRVPAPSVALVRAADPPAGVRRRRRVRTLRQKPEPEPEPEPSPSPARNPRPGRQPLRVPRRGTGARQRHARHQAPPEAWATLASGDKPAEPERRRARARTRTPRRENPRLLRRVQGRRPHHRRDGRSKLRRRRVGPSRLAPAETSRASAGIQKPAEGPPRRKSQAPAGHKRQLGGTLKEGVKDGDVATWTLIRNCPRREPSPVQVDHGRCGRHRPR